MVDISPFSSSFNYQYVYCLNDLTFIDKICLKMVLIVKKGNEKKKFFISSV